MDRVLFPALSAWGPVPKVHCSPGLFDPPLHLHTNIPVVHCHRDSANCALASQLSLSSKRFPYTTIEFAAERIEVCFPSNTYYSFFNLKRESPTKSLNYIGEPSNASFAQNESADHRTTTNDEGYERTGGYDSYRRDFPRSGHDN